MPTRMHRTQILIEPELHEAIAEVAQREQRSVSDVIREMLNAQMHQRKQAALAKQKQRLEALARIQEHRQAILDRRQGEPLQFDVVALIEQIRDERDAVVGRGLARGVGADARAALLGVGGDRGAGGCGVVDGQRQGARRCVRDGEHRLVLGSEIHDLVRRHLQSVVGLHRHIEVDGQVVDFRNLLAVGP